LKWNRRFPNKIQQRNLSIQESAAPDVVPQMSVMYKLQKIALGY